MEEESFAFNKTPEKTPKCPTMTTPSGGRIYHPFHEGYVARLSHATVTPGLFSNFSGNKTPFKKDLTAPVQFLWSPEIKGDLFPADIDENPVYQLKLQQMLDVDVEDAAQQKIKKFFQSNIIAPSPDGSTLPFKVSQCSSLAAASPSAGRSNDSRLKTIMMADVEVQTSVSMAPDVDFVTLLQKDVCLNESATPSENTVQETSIPRGVVFRDASAVHVNTSYPHSTLFQCISCQQTLPLTVYRRRSLFVEAAPMETIKDVSNSPEDKFNIYGRQSNCATNNSQTAQDPASDLTETMAADLGLPVSWATESVCYNSAQQDFSMRESTGWSSNQTQRQSRTDITTLFDSADNTPIKNISMCLETSQNPDTISPSVIGRNGNGPPIIQLVPSFSLDDESTRDNFGTCRSDLGDYNAWSEDDVPRKRLMISPQLSPIPRTGNYSSPQE